MRRLRPVALLALVVLLLAGFAHTRAKAANVPSAHEEHMEMTLRATELPGDRVRADAILAAARKVMAQYPTVNDAERAGFVKFLPGVKLPIEHYTNRDYAIEAWFGHFDPMHPTSLIFKRSSAGLQLVGVMYTASNNVDRDDLDARVPLSYGTWHRHVDFCKAPAGTPRADYLSPGARFGLLGSIDTPEACAAAGGKFIPIVFGWMVHVWPNETTREKIWAVDAKDDGMMHDHGAGMVSLGNRGTGGLPIPLAKLPTAEIAAGDAGRGATLFAQNCASCHGNDAKNGPDAPALAGAGLSPGQVAFMVRHPQAIDAASAMPSISLANGDLADIAAYVASLKE